MLDVEPALLPRRSNGPGRPAKERRLGHVPGYGACRLVVMSTRGQPQKLQTMTME